MVDVGELFPEGGPLVDDDSQVPGMAEAVEARRQSEGLSPTEFAQRAGLTQQGLSDVRAGKRKRYAEKTRRGVARALRWPDDWYARLLDGEDARGFEARPSEEPDGAASEALDLMVQTMGRLAQIGDQVETLTDDLERVMAMSNPRSNADIDVPSTLREVGELTVAMGPILRGMSEALAALPREVVDSHQRELEAIANYLEQLTAMEQRLGPMLESVDAVLDRERFALAAQEGLPEEVGPPTRRPQPDPEPEAP